MPANNPLPLPDHEKTWFTHANVPLPMPVSSRTSAANIYSGLVFNLKALLCGHMTSGSLSTSTGARNANSIWTVVSSSDGVNYTGSVDRWGTTFDSSKIFTGGYTAAHSWIILQNNNLGYQCLIDLNGGSGGYMRLSFTKTTSPFVATSTASPSAPSEAFIVGSNSNSNSVSPLLIDDTANYDESHYMHFCTDSNGEFFVLVNRLGVGFFHSFFSFMSFSDGPAGNTRNYYGMQDTSATGAPRWYSGLFGSGGGKLTGRTPDGSLITNAGMIGYGISSNTSINIYGPNYVTGKNDHFRMRGMSTTANNAFYCGYVPDMYISAKGDSIKNLTISSVKKYILAGCALMPFVDVTPML